VIGLHDDNSFSRGWWDRSNEATTTRRVGRSKKLIARSWSNNNIVALLYRHSFGGKWAEQAEKMILSLLPWDAMRGSFHLIFFQHRFLILAQVKTTWRPEKSNFVIGKLNLGGERYYLEKKILPPPPTSDDISGTYAHCSRYRSPSFHFPYLSTMGRSDSPSSPAVSVRHQRYLHPLFEVSID